MPLGEVDRVYRVPVLKVVTLRMVDLGAIHGTRARLRQRYIGGMDEWGNAIVKGGGRVLAPRTAARRRHDVDLQGIWNTKGYRSGLTWRWGYINDTKGLFRRHPLSERVKRRALRHAIHLR